MWRMKGYNSRNETFTASQNCERNKPLFLTSEDGMFVKGNRMGEKERGDCWSNGVSAWPKRGICTCGVCHKENDYVLRLILLINSRKKRQTAFLYGYSGLSCFKITT